MMMTVEKLINFVEPSAVGTNYRIVSNIEHEFGKICDFSKNSEFKNTAVKISRWINENSEWVFVINI